MLNAYNSRSLSILPKPIIDTAAEASRDAKYRNSLLLERVSGSTLATLATLGALMTAACVTHSVPDATAKLYAATQTMDEARHVEVFARYCDKVAMVYPMSGWLKQLIDA
ncbi:MAG TPA: hypothetical protein PK072_11565, partial [Quisquiliibacterium sp.]|nr:hypothetical protein [Quisquiliibacterium sp.]